MFQYVRLIIKDLAPRPLSCLWLKSKFVHRLKLYILKMQRILRLAKRIVSPLFYLHEISVILLMADKEFTIKYNLV